MKSTTICLPSSNLQQLVKVIWSYQGDWFDVGLNHNDGQQRYVF